MEDNTSGFYKKEGNSYIFAPNAIRAPNYDLFRANKDGYLYPIHGWYWFDDKQTALDFFGIKL
jgi:hypothetical protein